MYADTVIILSSILVPLLAPQRATQRIAERGTNAEAIRIIFAPIREGTQIPCFCPSPHVPIHVSHTNHDSKITTHHHAHHHHAHHTYHHAHYHTYCYARCTRVPHASLRETPTWRAEGERVRHPNPQPTYSQRTTTLPPTYRTTHHNVPHHVHQVSTTHNTTYTTTSAYV